MLHKQKPVLPVEMRIGHKYRVAPKNGKILSEPMTLKEFNSEGKPIFRNSPPLNSGEYNFYGYYDPATGYNAANNDLGEKLLNVAAITAGAGFAPNVSGLRYVHPEGFRPGEPGALANMYSKTLANAKAARVLPREDLVVELPTGIRQIRGCTPLIKAAVQGDDVRVRTLLLWGFNNEKTDASRGTPLIWAVRAEQIPVVIDLLRLPGPGGIPANVNAYDVNGFTPIEEALRARNIELVEILLDYHANPNTMRNRVPLLQLAIRNRANNIALLLIARNANPAFVNENGENALNFALELGYNDLIAIELLKRGVVPSGPVDFPTVCSRGNLELIRLLSNPELGIDIDMIGDGNQTALTDAILSNNIDIARELLAQGADPNKKNGWGDNAYALSESKPAMRDLLRQAERNRNPGGRGSGSGKRTRKRKARKSRSKSRKV